MCGCGFVDEVDDARDALRERGVTDMVMEFVREDSEDIEDRENTSDRFAVAVRCFSWAEFVMMTTIRVVYGWKEGEVVAFAIADFSTIIGT